MTPNDATPPHAGVVSELDSRTSGGQHSQSSLARLNISTKSDQKAVSDATVQLADLVAVTGLREQFDDMREPSPTSSIRSLDAVLDEALLGDSSRRSLMNTPAKTRSLIETDSRAGSPVPHHLEVDNCSHPDLEPKYAVDVYNEYKELFPSPTAELIEIPLATQRNQAAYAEYHADPHSSLRYAEDVWAEYKRLYVSDSVNKIEQNVEQPRYHASQVKDILQPVSDLADLLAQQSSSESQLYETPVSIEVPTLNAHTGVEPPLSPQCIPSHPASSRSEGAQKLFARPRKQRRPAIVSNSSNDEKQRKL